VISGKQVVSKRVRQQVERHTRDLKDAHIRSLVFDPAKGLHAIEFIERFIPGTADEYKGKPFILEPWAATLIFILYGWCWADSGLRRFKFAYVEVSRGNLKSTIASALCLYELLTTPGAEVYSASTDRGTYECTTDGCKTRFEINQHR
jgi:phage terminase large subunit-like protein